MEETRDNEKIFKDNEKKEKRKKRKEKGKKKDSSLILKKTLKH